MKKNNQKLERPKLSNLINSETKDIEAFQNQVLRPIIKMQHSLLIAFFIEYLKTKSISFKTISSDNQNEFIEAVLTKDVAFKNLILGIIIGHLTLIEFDFFKENSNEYKRRIIQMIKKRFKDSKSEITA